MTNPLPTILPLLLLVGMAGCASGSRGSKSDVYIDYEANNKPSDYQHHETMGKDGKLDGPLELSDVLKMFARIQGLDLDVKPDLVQSRVVVDDVSELPWGVALSNILVKCQLDFEVTGNKLRVFKIDAIVPELTDKASANAFPHVYCQVYAYNPSNIEFQVWLEKKNSVIVQAPAECRLDIYSTSRTNIYSEVSHKPDTNGVFYIKWDFVETEKKLNIVFDPAVSIFFVRTSIKDNGHEFQGGHTFRLKHTGCITESKAIPPTDSPIAHINTTNAPTAGIK